VIRFRSLQSCSVLVCRGRHWQCNARGHEYSDDGGEAAVKTTVKETKMVSRALFKGVSSKLLNGQALQDWCEGKQAPERNAELRRRLQEES